MLLLKRLKWTIIRCWLKNIRRWSEGTINSHLTLQQFIKHPDRWVERTGERESDAFPGMTINVNYYEPMDSEKERWFDEKMLYRF